VKLSVGDHFPQHLRHIIVEAPVVDNHSQCPEICREAACELHSLLNRIRAGHNRERDINLAF
jgi:hypothetical protein